MTNETFEQLKVAYESGLTRPLAWRRAQLNALRRLVMENRDAFISSAMADLGKPAAETVLMELNLVAGEAQFVRNRLGLWTARHPKAMHWMLQPAAGWTIAEPKGVVLIISPWNYPVLLALEPMADALAAGNAVCLKPSELSPNTSKLLAELVPQYLDAEAVNLTPVTLELGGKSPCFVDHTADINVAARRIVWGKFTNAGQTCVAPDYVLATPDVAEALAKRIAVAVTEFYGKNPQDSPNFGRIINERHFDRLCKLLPVGTVPSDEPSSPLIQVASAVGAAVDMVGKRINAAASGNTAAEARPDTAETGIVAVPGVVDPAGRVMCGGKVDRAARYVAPTVLYGTQPDAPVMGEEIFGPILPIVVVEDAEAAIRFINRRSRPLAAYVFSRDHEVRLAFERQTSSGALGYSLPLGHLLSSRLPFGGVGGSGIGAYHGKEGFRTFSHIKTVVSKPQFPDTLRLVYPPFNEAKAKLIDLISKLS
mgnify:CR=1 FL=1